MALDIERLPVLADNYIWLVRERESGYVAAVDPAEAEAVIVRLGALGWRLSHILNTHHHMDHVGGNLALKRRYDCTIVGPRADRARIPGIDIAVGEGEGYAFGAAKATVFDVPGHTRGHIAYWFKDDDALFCGDTLFLMGCGRLFEGTPQQMWSSLSKLRRLPDSTRVYCAHEYTQANARFALSVDPANERLRARAAEVAQKRAAGVATVPDLLGIERQTNPFLRADQPELAAAVGRPANDPAAVFAEIRARKDRF